MECYVFSGEPAGAIYRDLIKFCCASAAKMLLVVRDPAQEPCAEIRGVLTRLEPFLLDSVCTNTWPGTILLTDRAMVYSYRACDELAALLSEVMSSLFGWLHPSAPEDPCFCRSDGEPLLVTTSHEQDAYLLLTASEHAALERRFPGLAAMLAKE